MTEQPAQPPPPARLNRKWILLGLGGACALVACVGLVIALSVAALIPASSQTVRVDATAVSTMPVSTRVGVVNTPTAVGALQQNGNTLGDPNAPVKIIEYADFQCPYCQRYSQETESQIIETYVKTGKVFYEYRSVGAFIGPESADAAQAAYCAGDEGKFWEYHDMLYSHWTGENVGDFTKEKLHTYAGPVGLDLAAFDACFGSGKYADRLEQDVANAKADGIHATPSFLINGTLVEGAQPFSSIQQAIDAALQGK